jgi:hypothetical protein
LALLPQILQPHSTYDENRQPLVAAVPKSLAWLDYFKGCKTTPKISGTKEDPFKA